MFCPACHSDYPGDWKVCPKDATTLLKTPQIGKYIVEGLLGQGGMGAVYRAINPDTKGRVAIKVMHPSMANADAARQRFQREAAAVAALRTAHVVKVYDFGSEPDGMLYLVMELLDGHPVRDEIGDMDLSRVQMVLDGALKGLAAAHKAGIVHRDLKPDNIIVADTDDGEVPKLLDFGIARVRSSEAHNLTRTGSVMGTASYMAPEQAGGGGEIGPWSDVYAMGAILYEMLSGIPAYGGTTVTEVLAHVMRSEHPPLRTRRPDLPDAVYTLVERCMSHEPVERPQDAEALRIAVADARLVPIGTPIVGWGGGATGAVVTAGTPSAGSSQPATPGVAPTIGDDGQPLPGRESHGVGTRPNVVAGANVATGANVGSKIESKAPVAVDPPARSSRRWLVVVAAIVVAAGITIAIVATSGSRTSGGGSDLATKPPPAIDAELATTPADAATVAMTPVDAIAVAPPIDAAHVAQTIDAGHTTHPIDAGHPIDAAVAHVIVDAAPTTADCSNTDELIARARQLSSEDNWSAALPVALQAAACRPGNPNMHRIVTIAACMAGNETLAAEHFNHVINQRNNVREICSQHHVALP